MDYENIPEEFHCYLNLTREVYDSLDDHIKNTLLEVAERKYLEDHMDDSTDEDERSYLDLDNIDVYVESGEEFVGNRGASWKYRRVIATFITPLHVGPNDVAALGDYMDRLRERHSTGRYIPVLYTLSIMNIHENTLPDSAHMISTILHRLDEYDGNFVVDSFTITYKKGYDRRRYQGGIRVGSGEGIPRYIKDGFWELDLYQTKKKCIPNSYTLWLLYKEGKLDDVIQGNYDTFINKRSTVDVDKESIQIRDVVGDGEFDIVYSDDITNINPRDTKKICWFVYSNSHVGLLVHEKYLQKESIKQLKKLSNKTVVHKIKTKSINPNKIEIVAADMEMYREKGDDDNIRKHIPRLVGHYTKDGYISYRGGDAVNEYLKYLVDAKRNWLIWFHNGGKYDVHFLIKPMIKYLDKNITNFVGFRDLKGKFIEATFHIIGGYTITFRDSCSLMPGKLKKLAKDMDVSRKRDDLIDIMEVTEKQLDTCPIVLEYHRADCKSLYELLEKYQLTATDTFGTNPLHHVSGSSFAKRIFFSTYYDEKRYPLYVLSKKTRDFISKGYGGGRNEATMRGIFEKTSIVPYDFTSFYPSVARGLIPYGKPKWIDNLEHIKMKDMEKFLKNNPGFYEVEILSSPTNKHPLHGTFYEHKYVFPYFEKYDGLVIFSPEIILGIGIGYKYKLKCGYTQQMAPICKKFFEKMISVKMKAAKEGHKALEYSGKINANSGYGFYGFNPYDRTVMKVYGEDMLDHLISMEHNAQLSYRKEEDVYICSERTNVLLPDINISVAAAITSYARMRLWELIQDIKDIGGVVYYYDTDSVYSSIDIVKHPVLGPKWCGPGKGKNLGELKRELPTKVNIKKMVIVGCKTYGYKTTTDGYVTKSKGTRNPDPMKYKPYPDDVKYLDDDENYKDDCIMYEKNVEMFGKLCSFIRRKNAKKSRPQKFNVTTISTSRARKTSKDMDVYEKTVEKTLTGIYTKGKVLKNGMIIPLVLKGKSVRKYDNIDDGIVVHKDVKIPVHLCDKDPDGYVSDHDDRIPLHLLCDKDPDDYMSDNDCENTQLYLDEKYPDDYDSDMQYEEPLDW